MMLMNGLTCINDELAILDTLKINIARGGIRNLCDLNTTFGTANQIILHPSLPFFTPMTLFASAS